MQQRARTGYTRSDGRGAGAGRCLALLLTLGMLACGGDETTGPAQPLPCAPTAGRYLLTTTVAPTSPFGLPPGPFTLTLGAGAMGLVLRNEQNLSFTGAYPELGKDYSLSAMDSYSPPDGCTYSRLFTLVGCAASGSATLTEVLSAGTGLCKMTCDPPCQMQWAAQLTPQ